jgi:hypothetical protein
MLDKTNIIKNIRNTSFEIGTIVMTIAAVVGMLELPAHNPNRVFAPQSVNISSSSNLSELNNPVRREKEEGGQVFVSYAESQRTPGRTGKY